MAVAGQPRRFHDIDHRLMRGIGVGIDHDHRIHELPGCAAHLVGQGGNVAKHHRLAVDGVLPGRIDGDIDFVGPFLLFLRVGRLICSSANFE